MRVGVVPAEASFPPGFHWEERRHVAALLLVLAGCGGGGEAPPVACTFGAPGSYTVSDSARVRIVENRCPQMDFGWEIGPSPALEIGGVDVVPAEQFRGGILTWVTRLSDGRLAVLERAPGEVRYFSPAGEHLMTVGGRGDGPGEFRTPVYPLLLLPRDSLAVFDVSLRRGTLYDPTGRVVSTVRVDGPDLPGSGLLPVARLSDGSFLVQTSVSPSGSHREEGVYPWIWSVWRAWTEGGPPVKVLEFPGELELASYANGLFTLAVPFSQTPYVGWWEDGLVVGNRTEYSFRRYDLAGSLTLVVRRDFRPRPVTERELIDRRDKFLSGMRQLYLDEFIPSVMRLYESRHVPRTHPAFDPAIVDRVGNLWVGQNQAVAGENHLWYPPGLSDVWSVFGPDGVWITDVRMPEGLRVSDIGDDYVLGVWEDELGVGYVREYELVKN